MYHDLNIGERIKDLRIHLGLTQQDLADRTELTKGYISQLERDLTVPSVPTLLDILQCLGCTPAEFFSEEAPEPVVFKPEDCFEKIDEKRKNQIRWLIPNSQINMQEPILVTLDVGGETEEDKPHEGEEFGYVLAGQIKLYIGSTSYTVRKDEAFYFEAKKKHRIINCGQTKAKFLWIATPPTF